MAARICRNIHSWNISAMVAVRATADVPDARLSCRVGHGGTVPSASSR